MAGGTNHAAPHRTNHREPAGLLYPSAANPRCSRCVAVAVCGALLCEPRALADALCCVQGCYDIGLPSGKSLFQLHAERILRLQALAERFVDAQVGSCRIMWYILTSAATHDATLAFFDRNAFFGLDRSQVFVFQQASLPCLTEEGRAIVQSDGSVRPQPPRVPHALHELPACTPRHAHVSQLRTGAHLPASTCSSRMRTSSRFNTGHVHTLHRRSAAWRAFQHTRRRA